MQFLERYRRSVAITIAVAVGGFLFFELPRVLDQDWPLFHARLMAITCGVVLALVIEVGLAGLLSWWEVQHDRLLRPALPRAAAIKETRLEVTGAGRSGAARHRDEPG